MAQPLHLRKSMKTRLSCNTFTVLAILTICMTQLPIFAHATCLELLGSVRQQHALLPDKIIQYAYDADVNRSKEDKKFWLAYKNTPNPTPRHFYFDTPDELSPSKRLSEWFKENAFSRYEIDTFKGQPTMYEQWVLELKVNDYIHFEDATFQVGKFVGAGNATQIFRIVGQPYDVLRIPFSAAQTLAMPGVTDGDLQTLQKWRLRATIRYMAKLYVDSMATQTIRGEAQTRSFSKNNSWVVAEFIDSSENGTDFLTSIATVSYETLYNIGLRWPEDFKSDLTSDQFQKLEEIFVLLRKENRATGEIGPGKKGYLKPEYARQFLRDESGGKPRWRAVDDSA